MLFAILPPQYNLANFIVFVPVGKEKLAEDELEVYAGVADNFKSKKHNVKKTSEWDLCELRIYESVFAADNSQNLCSDLMGLMPVKPNLTSKLSRTEFKGYLFSDKETQH